MPWLATEGPPLLPALFAFAFVWLSVAIGRRLLIVLGAWRHGTLAERGIVAAALGAGALEYVPFVLGAAGALRPATLRIACAVVALAAARDLAAVGRAAYRAVREGPSRFVEPWLPVWIAALLPAFLIAALLALSPTIDPDGLGYHLTVPKRWLQSGHLEYLPTYPYSNAPMGAEMLFALAMVFAGDVAAKCVHFSLGTLGVVGLYLTGKRLHSRLAGAVAATLFLVGPVGVCAVLGCAYVEGAAAFAMIAAVVAWTLWLQTDDEALLRCAALLAGLAVTFKITAALLPAALLAMTWIAAVDKGRKAGREDRPLAVFARSMRLVPLMAAPIVPWFARSAIVTGNPFFPLFARWIPSRDFPPDLSAKFDQWNRYMTWGNVAGRGWTLHQRALVLGVACAVTALAGIAVSIRARSWMARGTAIVVTVAVVAQLSAAGLYTRYSVPLAAVVALPIVVALGPLLSRRASAGVWIALTFVVSLAQAKRTLSTADNDLAGLVRTDLGLESRHAFLVRHLALYPIYEKINGELPETARVMLSCYCAGFYIDRETFCADMVQTSLRFTDWGDFTSDLRRLGITHVIAPQALAREGAFPPLDPSSTSSITRESQYRYVRPLLEHAQTRGTASDQGLYQIDDAMIGAR